VPVRRLPERLLEERQLALLVPAQHDRPPPAANRLAPRGDGAGVRPSLSFEYLSFP
jgi:hypothetical protein